MTLKGPLGLLLLLLLLNDLLSVEETLKLLAYAAGRRTVQVE